MQCQRRTDTSFGCPLVGRRDLERRQAMHRDKLQRMGSSIDTRAPMSQPHLTLYGRDYVAKKRATTEAAFSDLKMIQSIAKTMTRKPDIPERKGPVSLNADARKTEIFRIMKENHRLLDRLETLEPMTCTTDLVRDYKYKQRYLISVSHSKRLAGEYDEHVMRIRTEDKAKTDEMNRVTQARLTRYRMNASSGSMSMPTLTPMAATDPSIVTQVSPAPKRRVVAPKTSPATNGVASSPSFSSAPAAAAAADAPTEGGQGDLEKKVSFSGSGVAETGERSQWQRAGGPTPHPRNMPSEMFFEEKDPDDDAVQAASPAAAAKTQEFDPAQSNATATEPPKVGVGGSTPDAAAAGSKDVADESYADDFADESMSKALDKSGTFESGQG